MKRRTTLLIMLLSCSLFIGLSVALFNVIPATVSAHSDIDSKAYTAHADLFYNNNNFVWPKPGKPYYVLGYPFIIGLAYKLYGQPALIPIIILQVIMSLASIFMLFFLLTSLNYSAGLIAMLLGSVNLGLLTFSQFILTEISLTLFLLFFTLLFVRYLQLRTYRHLLLSAFFLGLSVLIKPAALYFPILLVPLIIIINRWQKKSIFISFTHAFLWALLFAIPLNMYALHNWYTFNEWYISGLSSENITHWFYPNVKAELNGTSSDYERVQLIKLPQKHILRIMKTEFFNHPFIFIRVWCKNIIKSWLGLFTTNLKLLIEPTTKGGDISFFKTQGPFSKRIHDYITGGTNKSWIHGIGYSEIIWTLIRVVLLLFGSYFLIARQQWELLLFFMLYLAYFSAVTGHDGCARFRMLFEMQLLVLSSLGIVQLIPSLRNS